MSRSSSSGSAARGRGAPAAAPARASSSARSSAMISACRVACETVSAESSTVDSSSVRSPAVSTARAPAASPGESSRCSGCAAATSSGRGFRLEQGGLLPFPFGVHVRPRRTARHTRPARPLAAGRRFAGGSRGSLAAAWRCASPTGRVGGLVATALAVGARRWLVLGGHPPGSRGRGHGAGHPVEVELVLRGIETTHRLRRRGSRVGVADHARALGVGIGGGFPVADGEQFLLLADRGGGVAVQAAAFEFVAGEGSALLQFAGAVEPVGADGLDALQRLDPGGGDGGEVLGRGHVAFGQLAFRAADRVLVQPGPPDDRVAAVLLGAAPARRAGPRRRTAAPTPARGATRRASRAARRRWRWRSPGRRRGGRARSAPGATGRGGTRVPGWVPHRWTAAPRGWRAGRGRPRRCRRGAPTRRAAAGRPGPGRGPARRAPTPAGPPRRVRRARSAGRSRPRRAPGRSRRPGRPTARRRWSSRRRAPPVRERGRRCRASGCGSAARRRRSSRRAGCRGRRLRRAPRAGRARPAPWTGPAPISRP